MNSGPLLHVSDLPSALQYHLAAGGHANVGGCIGRSRPTAIGRMAGYPASGIIPLMEMERRAILRALGVYEGRPRDCRPSCSASGAPLSIEIERISPGFVKIALDATYSLGEHLSGVGVYSQELVARLAAAHPEQPFQFVLPPSPLFSIVRGERSVELRAGLAARAVASLLARFIHGLNQRLPAMRFR